MNILKCATFDTNAIIFHTFVCKVGRVMSKWWTILVTIIVFIVFYRGYSYFWWPRHLKIIVTSMAILIILLHYLILLVKGRIHCYVFLTNKVFIPVKYSFRSITHQSDSWRCWWYSSKDLFTRIIKSSYILQFLAMAIDFTWCVMQHTSERNTRRISEDIYKDIPYAIPSDL